MESRVKILGHPVHPMLIPFPLGLLPTAVVFDGIHLVTNNPQWSVMTFWMIAAGVIGGLAAAFFGLIDFFAIPGGTRAKRVGLLHAGVNVVAIVLFALSWVLRRDDPAAPEQGAMVISLVALLIAAVGGWLGGELVDRLGVGVDPGANLDAPSSLTAREAVPRTR
jgi:uncharacterized membrane protein